MLLTYLDYGRFVTRMGKIIVTQNRDMEGVIVKQWRVGLKVES